MNPIQGGVNPGSQSHREPSTELSLKPLPRPLILPDGNTPQGAAKVPHKLSKQEFMQVGRLSATNQYTSPSMQANTQIKKNAYMGYMQLQSLQHQQLQGHGQSLGTNLNMSKGIERSLEQSKGIAGVGMHPSQSQPVLQSARIIKPVKKKSAVHTSREFELQPRFVEQATGEPMDQELHFLKPTQQPSERNIQSRGGVGTQRKLTKVLGTTELGQSPSAFSKTAILKQATSSTNQNVSNIISMLKQKERIANFPSATEISNPGSSKSTLSQVPIKAGGQSLSGLNLTSKKKPAQRPAQELAHQHRVSNGQGEMQNFERALLVGNEIGILKPQNTLQQIEEDYLPQGKPLQGQIASRKNLSQSPQSHHPANNPFLAMYGIQGASSSMLRTTTLGPGGGLLKLQVPRGANFQCAGLINLGNLSSMQDEQQSITFMNGNNQASQGLNSSQFRRRNANSLKRLGEQQHFPSQQLSKSSMSQKTLRPQTITNNFSTTQRSIQIYRNAVKNSQSSSLNRNDSQSKLRRESFQVSGVYQEHPEQLVVITSKSLSRGGGGLKGSQTQRINLQGVTQFQGEEVQGIQRVRNFIGQTVPGANSGGFIDRTIKTSASQFISPKTTIEQINKGMTSGGAPAQSIQFFNNQLSQRNQGPFGPISAQPKVREEVIRQFSQCRMVRNMSVRRVFNQLKQALRDHLYREKRESLFRNMNLFKNSPSTHFKLLKVLDNLSHFNYFKSFRIVQDQIVLTEAHSRIEKSLQTLTTLIKQNSNSQKGNQFMQGALQSLSQHLMSIHEKPSLDDKLTLRMTLEENHFTILPMIALPIVESYLRNLKPSVSSFLEKLSSQQHIPNDLLFGINSDLSSLPLAIKLVEDNTSKIREYFLKSKVDKEAMSDLDHWRLMEDFLETLDSLQAEIPLFNYIILDLRLAVQEIHKLITQVKSQIQQRLVTSLERDTSSLRGDLSKSMELLSLQQPPANSTLSLSSGGTQHSISINLYIEQLTTVRTLSPTMLETLSQRLAQIKTIQSMLYQSNVPMRVAQNTRELDQCIEKLPGLVRQCSERLAKQRPQMEQVMVQGCLSLGKKIKQFQDKYIDRYAKRDFCRESMDLLQARAVNEEITLRAKMISDIQGKVRLHSECIEIVGMQGLIAQHRDITCFKDIVLLEELHIANLALWENMVKLLELEHSILNTKVSDMTVVLLQFKSYSLPMPANPILEKLAAFIAEKYDSLSSSVSLIQPLITAELTAQQWQLLRDIKKCAPLEIVEDLLKAKAYGQDFDLVIKLSERDSKQRNLLAKFKALLKSARLEVREEKMLEGKLLMLAVNETVFEDLDDQVMELSKLAKCPDIDLDITSEAQSLTSQGLELKDLILRIKDFQKSLISISAFLTPLRHKLSNELRLFKELLRQFESGISSLLKEGVTFSDINEQKEQIADTLEGMEPTEDMVHQGIDGYFEQKRLLFPRLFFMADSQCLQFIELFEKQESSFNFYIPLIFPGADGLLIGEAPCPPEGCIDITQLDSAPIQDIAKLKRPPITSKGTVKGMVSCHKELLMFTQEAPFIPTALAETLQGVETAMQQTIGNLIASAVGSFPKQSLDEWIMDYPLQTILTTIHLILTHEINELFDDIGRRGDNEQEGQQENSGQLDENFDEYGRKVRPNMMMPLNEVSDDNRDMRARQLLELLASHHKTPDTRDLVVATASTHNHKLAANHHHQRTISLQHLNEELFMNKHRAAASILPFGKSIAQQPIAQHNRIKSCAQVLIGGKLDLRVTEEQYSPVKVVQLEETLVDQESLQDWRQFRADMFGWDFDLLNDNTGKDKEDTMRVLQEKSFKGLYLRLQFWINQICKSLKLNKRPEDMEVKGCITHHAQQEQGMQTIINFLAYMRDVVFELKQKQVSSIEDFDWQKQIRLTWQGNAGDDTKGCKVECGAWQTFQANEYSGNFIQRLPITPLTNKYFIFIAAALREKSAVLFRCMPTHDYALDVYQEFANTCAVPLRSFHCAHPQVSMKSLMQFLNGAALASTWIFFEHIDKLCHLHLQTFNKEIQMVQQQFIIAELSQDDSQDQNQEEGQEELPVPEGLNSSQQQLSAVRQNFQSPFSIGVRTNQMGRRLGLKSKQQSPLETSQKVKRQEGEFSNRYDDNQHYYDELPPPQMDSSQKQAKSHSQRSQQNKVSFGVFASFSHRFNIRHEKWATDVSVQLQSAFRVLSLTRPEFPLLTAMLLKSHGFVQHQVLSQKLHEGITEILGDVFKEHLDDRSDHVSSVTVRDIRLIVVASEALLLALIKTEEPSLAFDKEILSVASVFRLWMFEKMQGLIHEKSLDDQLIKDSITKIITRLFGVEPHSPSRKVIQEGTVQAAAMSRNLIFTQAELKTLGESMTSLQEYRALCLVGPSRSGKHTLVDLLVRDLLHMKPTYFNPSISGTFRELFGVADPLSIQQLSANDQLGTITSPLFEVTVNSLTEDLKGVLVLTCDFSDPLSETFRPYFEGTLNGKACKGLVLPNGVMLEVKFPLKVIMLSRTLANATPRMISALQLHCLRNEVPIAHIIKTHFPKSDHQKCLNGIVQWLQARSYSHTWIADSLRNISILVAKYQPHKSIDTLTVACLQIIGLQLPQKDRTQFASLPIFKGLKDQDPSIANGNLCFLRLINGRLDYSPEYYISNQGFILSPLLQAIESQVVSSGLSFTIDGQGKSALITHLCDRVPTSLLLLETPLLSFRTLRHLLLSSQPRPNQPLTVFIDDVGMQASRLVPYLEQLRLNQLSFASTDSMQKLNCTDIQIISAKQNLKGAVNFTLENPLMDGLFTEALLNANGCKQEDSGELRTIVSRSTSMLHYVTRLRVLKAGGHRMDEPLKMNHLKTMPSNLIFYTKPGSQIQLTEDCALLDIDIPSAFKSYTSIIEQLNSSLTVQKDFVIIRLREGLTKDPLNTHIIGTFLKAIQCEKIWWQWQAMSHSSISWERVTKVSERIRVVLESAENNDRFLWFETVVKQSGDEVIESVSSKCIQLLHAYNKSSSLKIPQAFISSEERPHLLQTIYNNLKAIVSKSLSKQIALQQALKRKYSILFEQVRQQRQPDVGQLPYKQQVTLMNLLTIKERLDLLTQSIRSLDSQIRAKQKELDSMREQLGSRREAEPPMDFSTIMKTLKRYDDHHFQSLKSTLRDEQMSQLLFTLSLACKVKRIFDLTFREVCGKLESAHGQQVSLELKQAMGMLRQISGKESIERLLFQALSEIVVGKQATKSTTMSLQSLRIKISSLQSSLTIMRQQISLSNDEAEELIIKEANLKKELDSIPPSDINLQQSIEFRKDYTIRAIVKQGKSTNKLDKLLLREKRLEGDCLMVAASVVYLGALPFQERIKARAELSEHLLLRLNLEASDCWGKSESASYFKKVLYKDLQQKRPSSIPQSAIEGVYAEYAVSQMLSPNAFISVDNSGIYIAQLKLQTQAAELSGADQNAPEVLIRHSDKTLIVVDYHDFISPPPGRTQDLGTLLLNKSNLILSAPSLQITDHTLLSNSVIFNASSCINKNEAWIDIKLTLLKHFLPDTHQKLTVVLGQINSLKTRIRTQKVLFTQLFQTALSEDLSSAYLTLRQLEEDHAQFTQMFHSLINEHPLLASYSNILVIMYQSLKELPESTYSWEVYTKMINLIVAKVIRDLTLNMKKNAEDSQHEGENKEFTIDEEFFHTVIMPGIYTTVVSGIRQEHIALFNLIFAFEIALKKGTIEAEEKALFFRRFYQIEGYLEWRRGGGFNASKIDQEEAIKDIEMVYPEAKKLLGDIKERRYVSFRDIIMVAIQAKHSMVKQLNIGFLCPDAEWRSKLTQFTYEELTTIFDFTEDLSKLHNFIKTASWNLPVALYTQNPINIVNTVCSIASYYGVGLEVLRTDSQVSIRSKKRESYYVDRDIFTNLGVAVDHFNDEAAVLHKPQEQTPQQVYKRMFAKDEMDVEEKQHSQQQTQVDLIKRCALNGTWVLISTLKFPSYWSKVCKVLQKMAHKGKIMNTFRIFFDLQGYSMGEIPESFAFDRAVKFYLTDKNGEDMEGFNDVWANILNDDLLNAKELTSQQPERQSIAFDESMALPESITPGYLEEIIAHQRKKLVTTVSGFGRDLESPKHHHKKEVHDISGVSSIKRVSQKRYGDVTINSMAQSFIFEPVRREEQKQEKPAIEMVSSRHPTKRLQPGQKHQSK